MVLGLHCRARGVWQKVWLATCWWLLLTACLQLLRRQPLFFHTATALPVWPRGAGLSLRRLTPAGVAQGGLGLALPGQGCLAKSLAGKVTVAARWRRLKAARFNLQAGVLA